MAISWKICEATVDGGRFYFIVFFIPLKSHPMMPQRSQCCLWLVASSWATLMAASVFELSTLPQYDYVMFFFSAHIQ